MNLEKVDFEIAKAISNEKTRQSTNINLIASENYASSAVMKRKAQFSQTSMLKATQEDDITEVVKLLTKLKNWLLNELRNFLEQTMQMFKLIVVLKQIWLVILQA